MKSQEQFDELVELRKAIIRGVMETREDLKDQAKVMKVCKLLDLAGVPLPKYLTRRHRV